MRESIEKLVEEPGDLLPEHFGKDPQLLELGSSIKEAVAAYDKTADKLIVQESRRVVLGLHPLGHRWHL